MLDYGLLLPEFILAAVAFIILGVDLFLPREQKGLTAYLAIIGLAIGGVAAVMLPSTGTTMMGGMFIVDRYAIFFKVFFAVVGIFIILLSMDYIKRLRYEGEYYSLIVFSTLGMVLMTASGELLTAYIGLELLSFSLYVLAGFDKMNAKSNEASLKYVLLGAFASAILLYGISLVYGYAKTTTFAGIAAAVAVGPAFHPTLLVGMMLILSGLGFKLAAVPFHMWAPDVYEGAPTPITAYLSVASKAAAFGLVLRLFGTAFIPAADEWRWPVVILAALSMTLGNLVAIHQKNIKRLLAYSSIGQAGYLLVGVAAMAPTADPAAVGAIMIHLVGYAASNLAVFACIIIYSNLTGKETLPEYAGLAERAPFVALALTISLLSLAGLPFFAGFVTKFYLFAIAVEHGLLWLVALAVANSLVSFYYYMLIMRPMYVSQPDEPGRLPIPVVLYTALVLLLIGVVGIGLWPSPIFDWATAASLAFLR